MPPRKPKITATKTKAISTAHALNFFLCSVQDPNQPTHCGTCLNGAFVECTTMDEKALQVWTKALPKVKPELWDAAMGFLVAKRSEEQVQNLLVRLSDCRCQMQMGQDQGRVRRYHEIGKHAATTSETLMTEVDGPPNESESDAPKITETGFAFILNILNTLSFVVENSHLTSAAKGSSSSWPINLTDLLPSGGDGFVEAMLQWYRFIPDPVVFRLTGHVLRFCQMLVIPGLIKYNFIDTVVKSTRRMVDVTLAIESMESPSPLLSQVFARRFYLHATDFRVYFQATLYNVPYSCKGALFRGSETKAMQLCSMILYLDNILDSSADRPADFTSASSLSMGRFGQDLFRLFHMHMYPRPSMPVHPMIHQIDSKCFPPPASCRAPRETALFTIRAFRVEARCSAQGCSNSFQSVGKRFQRCARCAVVAYCGRDCQMRAWKEEEYPHKRVCPAFRTLIEKGGGPALFFENTAVGESETMIYTRSVIQTIHSNWEKVGLSDEDLALIEDWGRVVEDSRGYPVPDGTEWTPGYDDYNDVISSLCTNRKSKIRVYKYLNRLARWPSEVAKEEQLLKVQPFWEEEIVGFWASE